MAAKEFECGLRPLEWTDEPLEIWSWSAACEEACGGITGGRDPASPSWGSTWKASVQIGKKSPPRGIWPTCQIYHCLHFLLALFLFTVSVFPTRHGIQSRIPFWVLFIVLSLMFLRLKRMRGCVWSFSKPCSGLPTLGCLPNSIFSSQLPCTLRPWDVVCL